MDERRLEVFSAVADELSFTGAARRLHLSQSGVSQQVAALERELGAVLFERTRRSVRLTAAGVAFRRHAEAVLAESAAGRRAVAAAQGAVEGDFTVAASLTIGSYVLPPALAVLVHRHPALRPLVRVENTQQVVAELRAGTIDLGFVEGVVDDPAVSLERIGRDELVLIAPAGHRFEAYVEVPLAELAAEPLVVREQGSGTRQVAELHLRAAGLRAEDLRVVAELTGIEATKGAVESGVGVAIISAGAVKKELRLGTLVARPVAGLSIEREINAAVATGRLLAPAVPELLGILHERRPL
ncbi:MAG: LysR substrate-binding domain-containing protein [Gaiellaceae bacterium]